MLCVSERLFLTTTFLTVYPPQAVRQVVLAVDCLVAGGDVAEVAGLLQAVWWGEGLEGEQAVVAVHLRRYICQRQRQFQKGKIETDPTTLSKLWVIAHKQLLVFTNTKSTIDFQCDLFSFMYALCNLTFHSCNPLLCA